MFCVPAGLTQYNVQLAIKYSCNPDAYPHFEPRKAWLRVCAISFGMGILGNRFLFERLQAGNRAETLKLLFMVVILNDDQGGFHFFFFILEKSTLIPIERLDPLTSR